MKKILLLAAWVIYMIVPGLASPPESNHYHPQQLPFLPDGALPDAGYGKDIAEPGFAYLEGIVPDHLPEHYRRLFHSSQRKDTVSGLQGICGQEKVDLDSLHHFVNELLEGKTYHHDDTHGNLIRTEIYMLDLYQYEPFDIPIGIQEIIYNSRGQKTLDRTLYLVYENLPDIEYFVDNEHEFDYDHAGRQTFYSYKYYDSNVGGLKNIYRWFIEYDVSSYGGYYYLRQNGAGQEWVNYQLQEGTFFADGISDMLYFLYANAQGEWVSGTKYDYASWHNEQNYEDVYIYFWVAADDDWHPYLRIYIIHNALDDMEFYYEFHYHEESWWEKFRYSYHYDENHWQTYVLAEIRPTPEAEYVNHRLWTYETNESGKKTLVLTQLWDTYNGIWVNHERWKYENDHPAGYTCLLYQLWIPAEEVWQKAFRHILEYDNAHNNTYDLYQSWSTQYHRWFRQTENIQGFNAMNRMVLDQRRTQQNPETLLWMGWGLKRVSTYDSYGLQNYLKFHSWNGFEQEFEWQNTRIYSHDYYGNIKKQQSINPFYQETVYKTLGYATYPVTIKVRCHSQPMEGAVLTMMGTSFVSDEQGMIFIHAALSDQMAVDYTIEMQGYNTRQGQLKIDRKLDMVFNMVATGTTTYDVAFIIKKGDLLLEDAMIYLTGYGHQYTCNEGHANFEDVLPENHISFMVTYGGLVYHGTITVAFQNLTVEVDIDQVTSVLMTELPQVSIYPNPVSHNLHVSLKGLPMAAVSIFDMSGRKVLKKHSLKETTPWMQTF